MTKLRSLQLNPQNLMHHMQDPRVMDALGVLLGVDLNVMKPEASGGGAWVEGGGREGW